MSGEGAAVSSKMAPLPVSLIDLLWETEELTVVTPRDEEDRRLRDEAKALMQRQAAHRPIDGATEWSEMEIDLPRRAERSIRSRGGASPKRPDLFMTKPLRTETLASRRMSRSIPDKRQLAAPPRAGGERAGEVIVRLLRLLASPEVQGRLAARLVGRTLQQEIFRLWFAEYRPVRCADLFSADATSGLRRLSVRMRHLLARGELWSAQIDVLLAHEDWRELGGRAELILADML